MGDAIRMQPAQRWVCFVAAGQNYGLPILKVMEVLRVSAIEAVPGAPHSVVGVINLRGQVLTVLDLRQRLGLQGHTPLDTHEARIVITDCGEELLGLLVDSVADVRKLLPSDQQEAPAVHQIPSTVRVLGVVNDNQGFLTLLDPDSLAPG
ncbi:purine-binding chemotaxis protein CheW [Solimonas aquatica]|uniref:Purine-binding chemotaxis protein CheW n=1 Tax=Solimonas aquatica TaxID=489703 RepID=A0A1H9ASQ2_9GAMM|nr:chemotaxis protein CheW [Solimonas aquatica]SEP79852.1 purine-binding chemotaxis protein CheW [Solimonas aquatica]